MNSLHPFPFWTTKEKKLFYLHVKRGNLEFINSNYDLQTVRVEIFHRACYHAGRENQVDVLERFFSIYGNSDRFSFFQALCGACEGGHFDLVKSLCSRYSPLHVNTIFEAACYGGYFEVVQYILEELKITNLDHGIYSASLRRGRGNDFDEIIELLINLGATHYLPLLHKQEYSHAANLINKRLADNPDFLKKQKFDDCDTSQLLNYGVPFETVRAKRLCKKHDNHVKKKIMPLLDKSFLEGVSQTSMYDLNILPIIGSYLPIPTVEKKKRAVKKQKLN